MYRTIKVSHNQFPDFIQLHRCKCIFLIKYLNNLILQISVTFERHVLLSLHLIEFILFVANAVDCCGTLCNR